MAVKLFDYRTQEYYDITTTLFTFRQKREAIEAALLVHKTRKHTAIALGITVKMLHKWIKKYNVKI